MGLGMRKPVLGVCIQQIGKAVCPFVQSGLHFCYLLTVKWNIFAFLPQKHEDKYSRFLSFAVFCTRENYNCKLNVLMYAFSWSFPVVETVLSVFHLEDES